MCGFRTHGVPLCAGQQFRHEHKSIRFERLKCERFIRQQFRQVVNSQRQLRFWAKFQWFRIFRFGSIRSILRRSRKLGERFVRRQFRQVVH